MNEPVGVTPDDAIIERMLSGDFNLSEDLLLWRNSKFYKAAMSELFKAATRVPKNYIDHENLTTYNDPGDLEHDIGINPAPARDDTDVFTFQPTEVIVKQIDAPWAEGTNAGGMDTGNVAANSIYYLFYIYKPSTNHIDAIFSLDKSGPLMPAGYTYKVRIMTYCTDAAANIINFRQIGDRVVFKTNIFDRAVGAIANTNRIAYPTSVPPNVVGIYDFEVYNGGATSVYYLWIDSNDRPDAAASSTNYTVRVNLQGGINDIEMLIIADATRNIYARGNSTNITISISTRGWIDDRGRDA
ncbi:MAG: hypothetical protein PHS14_08175 [Elusimicrobia bacterium]|nr:hypothetical protein [Elusimicrobiota bacterium]